MKLLRFPLALFALVFLSACSISLAEDIKPPPGYQPPVAAQTQSATLAGPVYPLVAPNPEDGEGIYAEKCAPCHGVSGKGDGPQAAQLSIPVAAIGSTAVARAASPADWYTMVTNGNMERFMPPFSSLTDRQRWDVVAYSFSLSTSEARLAEAAELYQANCAACHGEQGRGDGPDAGTLSTPPTNFASQALMADKSAAEMFEVITVGVPPDMPAYGDQLSESERWAVSELLRTFTFTPVADIAGNDVPPAFTEPEEISGEAEPSGDVSEVLGTGTVTGVVTNASDGQIPDELSVTLHGFDQMRPVITRTISIDADGMYAFEDVEMPDGRVFLTTVEFEGATYVSDIVTASQADPVISLPIHVYETTTDPAVLVVDRLHLFFEFVDEKTLRVIELYVVSNPGNRTLIPVEEGRPTLQFTLPEGASNLEFQDGFLGERFVETPDGFADTVAVRPGSGVYQILFAFDLPYNRKLDLVQPVHLPTNAVVVLVPDGIIQVKGEQLQDAGVRPVEGVNYHMYNLSSLAAGEEVQLAISGSMGGSSPALISGSNSDLVIGLGAFGLALVAAGVWLYVRNRSSQLDEDEEMDETGLPQEAAAESDDPDTLMDAILALDDLYQAGELPEEAYLQRRAELKARLAELLG